MPTRPRVLAAGEIYHIYNRSSGQKTIFHTDRDYARFLTKMREYQEQFPVDILAFCIMPNHFHLLLRPLGSSQPLGSKQLKQLGLATVTTPAQHFLHRLHTAYAKYYDASHAEHSGRVFQGTYRAKHVADDDYFATVAAYIHDNPVRAGLAARPEEWSYSSYHAFSTLRVAPTLRVEKTGEPILTPPPSDRSHAQLYAAFAAARSEKAEEVRAWLWS